MNSEKLTTRPSADLGVGVGFGLEIRYREEDQTLIDLAEKRLREYEELLLGKLSKEARDPVLARVMFLNDGSRTSLINTLYAMRKVLIPYWHIKA